MYKPFYRFEVDTQKNIEIYLNLDRQWAVKDLAIEETVFKGSYESALSFYENFKR